MPRFAVLLALVCFVPSTASAADILVVSDSFTDTNIATVLRGDGHTVTLVMNDFMFGGNPTLRADLSAYDAVFWSATADGGFGTVHDSAVLSNLTEYARSGGRVFVTGYNSVSMDFGLAAFLGATSVNSFPGSPAAVAMLDTSLTNGAVDIRGVIPTQYSFDLDGLLGLASDTIEIVGSTAGGPFGGGSGSQWTIRTIGSGEIAWVSNGDYMTPEPFSWSAATPGSGGAYNAAIRNFAAASEGSASEPGAPRVRFIAPFGIDEGAEIAIMIEVTDDEGDPVTFSWDTDDDGTFGEHAGETMFTVPEGTTDGDQNLRISVEASDGTHITTRTRTLRISNLPPVVTSEPPTMTSIDEVINYRIEVADPAGAADPPTFELIHGPGDVTVDGVFRWIPGEGDVTTPSRMTRITIEVGDGDGGTTQHEWMVEVSANHAPSPPMAVYPTGGIGLLETMPRLVVQNGTDIDGDVLSFTFELDSVPTFDGPDHAMAGPLDQTPGFTAWQLTSPLHIGRWYWRAVQSDGTASSEPVGSEFVVVPDPATIPDGGTPDGGGSVGTDSGTTVEGPRGCSCRVGSHGRSEGALALLFGLAFAIVRRRRH